jgi:hypothetical protein
MIDQGWVGAFRALWIVIPGFFVGWLVLDSVRKVFSEDDGLMRRLFADQPVTMIAVATTVGSLLVWGFLRILELR